VAYVAGFEKRVIYNASPAPPPYFHMDAGRSKTYSNQMLVGEAYPKLDQVISINILDFILFDEFKHYLSCHQIKEQITGNCYLDEIRYYFIELPKFAKTEEELERLSRNGFILSSTPAISTASLRSWTRRLFARPLSWPIAPT